MLLRDVCPLWVADMPSRLSVAVVFGLARWPRLSLDQGQIFACRDALPCPGGLMSDRVSRASLVVIALSLAVMAGRSLTPTAQAADTMQCEFKGPLTIRSFDDKLQVVVESAYSAPGSSSSSPMYVQVKEH